jgi:hypothetical protein
MCAPGVNPILREIKIPLRDAWIICFYLGQKKIVQMCWGFGLSGRSFA